MNVLIGDTIGDITTASGRPVVFHDPRHTEIVWEDLFSLRRVCRYGGHYPVTVLAHLALCTELATARHYTVLDTALVSIHDAAEAYLGDLPPKLKHQLMGFEELERIWEPYIRRELGLPELLTVEQHRRVKVIDNLALVLEMMVVDHPLVDVARERNGVGPVRREELRIAEEFVHPMYSPIEQLATIRNAVERAAA